MMSFVSGHQGRKDDVFLMLKPKNDDSYTKRTGIIAEESRPAVCAEAVGGSSQLELEPLRVLREWFKHGTRGVAGLNRFAQTAGPGRVKHVTCDV